MPRANYSRFSDGVTIGGVPFTVPATGRVYYVGNGTLTEFGIAGSDSNDGKTPERPFATLNYAFTKCTANRGDVIFVMPGHAESVTSTSLTASVAGVTVVGLGEGSLVPTFSFGATTSTITCSSANCTFKNIKVFATINNVAAAFTISGAGCVFEDIESADTSASVEFITVFKTTSTADNLKIRARHRGFAAGSSMTRYCDIVGCQDAIIEVDFFGKASTSVVDMRTTACDNIRVFGRFYNASASLTKNVTNNTTATWSVEGFDVRAGRHFQGSDQLAVHYDSSPTSLESALGTDGTTVTDSATSVLGAIGANNADNAYASNSVVANADGSVLERLEFVQLNSVPNLTTFTKADLTAATAWTTGNSPVTIFTVTGQVLMQVFMYVTTAITSTGATGTLALGTSTNTTGFIAATTANGTNFATGDVWTSATTTHKSGVLANSGNLMFVADETVKVTIATNSMTAGAVKIYCQWYPISAGATVA